MERKSLLVFQRELLEVVEDSISLNKFSSGKSIDAKMKAFHGVIGEFNRKYPSLFLLFAASLDRCSLRIFLKGCDTTSAYEKCSAVAGLKSLGLGSFDEADLSRENMDEVVEKARDTLYLSYYTPESGSTSFVLRHDKKRSAVEVLYDPADIAVKKSPLVGVLAGIALENFNPDIDIFRNHGHLGFTDLLSEKEKKQLLSKFNPPWRDA
ncbi:hypothetical protein HY638_00665 [Candidatus Woesearchaeota archaeon]|nr:hypothetical protein [Candidatus Woesearchaeota archaeon]